MLVEAAIELGLDVEKSWMIGDRGGDIGAGNAIGCKTIFIDRGYDESSGMEVPENVCYSLEEAAAIISKVVKINSLD